VPALSEPQDRKTRKVKSAAGSAEAPALKSSAALVVDQTAGQTLFAKNIDNVVPIASITKLMTGWW